MRNLVARVPTRSALMARLTSNVVQSVGTSGPVALSAHVRRSRSTVSGPRTALPSPEGAWAEELLELPESGGSSGISPRS